MYYIEAELKPKETNEMEKYITFYFIFRNWLHLYYI